MDYDAVVVGGGPAGLTAAGWLGRYRRRVLVVDSGEYRNRWVEHVHGLFANDPADPEDLRARSRRDLQQYPHVEVSGGRVIDAEQLADGGFAVILEGDRIRARRVVLASGVRDAFPDVERFFEFYGADVFHCPTCDGFEARGESVAVFGWEPHVAGFAVELLDWADQIRIITDGRPLDIGEPRVAALARFGIDVIEDRAVELLGERGDLQGVRLGSGARIDCTMGFFTIDHDPVTDLAQRLGCKLDDDGYVGVDDEAETTVRGVYAAGDITGGMQLVGLAIGEGTVAGVACARSLRGDTALPHMPSPAPSPREAMSPRQVGDQP
ncbi:MAG: NAD(P)/FAD-dependent oxidoreductase [Actinobacteria bacterium]|nr:NAD(P)/FAD-dependent oxidoreductase [Actinomycetota bacterium]